MSIKTLAWIALIGWMGGSTYWHVCKIKQLCGRKNTRWQMGQTQNLAGLTLQKSSRITDFKLFFLALNSIQDEI